MEGPPRVGTPDASSPSNRSRSILDYSIKFRTFATQSRWTDLSLTPAFYHGLQDSIKPGSFVNVALVEAGNAFIICIRGYCWVSLYSYVGGSGTEVLQDVMLGEDSSKFL